jgi:hypothetical protein
VDAGGLRVSRIQIDAFRNERGYLHLLETSAKDNRGCEELKQAILDGIQWENIPWRSSPLLFKRLKEEIVCSKTRDMFQGDPRDQQPQPQLSHRAALTSPHTCTRAVAAKGSRVALSSKKLGVKLTRRGEGAAELEVYFDPAIESGEKIIFSQYVHEHLLQNARDVIRLRHYVCPLRDQG